MLFDKINNKVILVKKELNIKSRFKALLTACDLLYWQKRYHLMVSEYFLFNFHSLKRKARHEYVRDYEVMHGIPDKFNNRSQWSLFDNKQEFNQFFSEYTGREWCLAEDMQENELLDFVRKHGQVMVKACSLLGGKGIKKVSCKDIEDFHRFYLAVKNDKCLIEEVIRQNESMASLNPNTLNSIRVITMIDEDGRVHTPFANVRIGRAGSDVDNFCAGGMTAGINMESGIVFSPAVDKNNNQYLMHPDTGTQIIGFRIPYWDKVKSMACEAALKLPGMRYVGWDVAIKSDGSLCFIEGNSNPEARIHQIPAGKGLRQTYRQLLGRW